MVEYGFLHTDWLALGVDAHDLGGGCDLGPFLVADGAHHQDSGGAGRRHRPLQHGRWYGAAFGGGDVQQRVGRQHDFAGKRARGFGGVGRDQLQPVFVAAGGDGAAVDAIVAAAARKHRQAAPGFAAACGAVFKALAAAFAGIAPDQPGGGVLAAGFGAGGAGAHGNVADDGHAVGADDLAGLAGADVQLAGQRDGAAVRACLAQFECVIAFGERGNVGAILAVAGIDDGKCRPVIAVGIAYGQRLRYAGARLRPAQRGGVGQEDAGVLFGARLRNGAAEQVVAGVGAAHVGRKCC